MERATRFCQAFRTHAAIQETVTAAFRAGTPICPDEAVRALLSANPDCDTSKRELEAALAKAAVDAGVTVIEQPFAPEIHTAVLIDRSR
ncbi:MAG TPA: hypothetical protein VN240_07125 [Propylenella sp.]|nr:hypothetical protein [Propylenella sp.]